MQSNHVCFDLLGTFEGSSVRNEEISDLCFWYAYVHRQLVLLHLYLCVCQLLCSLIKCYLILF